MSERKLLGEKLEFDQKVALAQLTMQPGWMVLVTLIGEACRQATEAVLRIEPSEPNYKEVLAGRQAEARAMSKFAKNVLDSCKVIHSQASREAKVQAGVKEESAVPANRFDGFHAPRPKQQS